MRTIGAWVVLLAWLLVGSTEAQAQGAPPRIITAWQTMYGVDGPFLGEDNEVRGIEGDELPWIVGNVRGLLRENGRLVIDVRGLVFPDDPRVPVELRGKNDESHFRAVVSCLSESRDEQRVVIRNVWTRRFPATVTGDAHIEERLELPEACVAPVVFIVGASEGYWFAVSGVET
jgi:hypothetical protein